MKLTLRLFLFLVLAGLLGCSEGEVIPLVPPGFVCERPLDNGWRNLTNICEFRYPADAVWPEGEMPVVTGDDGLILQCSSDAQWSVVDLPVRADLIALAANSDGDLMVAGQYGALAFRKNGQWQAMESLIEADWRDVRSQDRRMWLAGSGGALASCRPGNPLEMVSVPDDADLYAVCAFQDSVFTGGDDGLFQVLANNQWEDNSWPELGTRDVRSIVRLDDGRLAVWANGLWIRELDGWVRHPEYGYFLGSHLKVRDGYLWVVSLYHRSVRLDLSTDPWEEVDYNGYGFSICTAPGPENRALVLSDDGELTWLHQEADNSIVRRMDPAGFLATDHLFRLGDGMIVFAVDEALFKITTAGVEQVHSLHPEVEDRLRNSTLIDGASVDDFYTIWEMKLQHIQSGEVVLETEIPDLYSYPSQLLALPDNKLCVTLGTTVLLWNGSDWEVLSEGSYSRVFLTQHQSLVVTHWDDAIYYSADGPVTINLNMRAELAWETEPGVLGFMSDDFAYAQWEAGAESDGLIYLDPLPGCTRVYMEAINETSLGVLVATANHSLVIKVPENPYRNDWELVAGPSMHEISDLQVLEDGSLVAIGDYGHYIMIYSSSLN